MKINVPVPQHKTSAKKALYSAVAKLFGVGLGAGAGSLLYKTIGNDEISLPVAIILGLASFGLTWYAEYERDQL